MNKIIYPVLCLLMMLVGCSNKEKTTPAKLKLTLGGIANFSTGIGSGGAILFGKSSTGEQFGKIISTTEETIDLNNGDWNFYAVMWIKNTNNFDGKVHCGKSAQKLSGTAATISLNLNNANCTDSDFSGGDSYLDSTGFNHFANFYMEECDDLALSSGITCNRDNQGSALSYRINFKNYKKPSGGAPVFGNESLTSVCVPAAGLFSTAMNLNFPTGSQAMPFIVSVDMFMGTPDCGAAGADTKGVFTQTFYNGIGASTTALNKLAKTSANYCLPNLTTKESCEAMMGTWSGSTCSVAAPAVTMFNSANCFGGLVPLNEKNIKQMVSIPKTFLCGKPDIYTPGLPNPFAGGDGSIERPYKICTEWQLNQIGEVASPVVYSSSSYKLMNNLDMNVTDFNPIQRPACAGVPNSVYRRHHNFNPIGRLLNGGCTTSDFNSTYTYTGIFNGNNKTISNVRVIAEDADKLGFFRGFGNGAQIKNLSFNNLEVRGKFWVGGIAGEATSGTGFITNVRINEGNVEGSDTNTGGLVGLAGMGLNIQNVQVKNFEVTGVSNVGGLVGFSTATIKDSMFRGSVRSRNENVSGIGGIAGSNDGTITTSFAEGAIDSNSKYAGGLVGSNTGTITHSYANTYIRSMYSTMTPYLGGIVGYQSAGSISNVYSDGILKYTGSQGSPLIDGIVASGSGVSGCYSSATTGAGSCSSISLDQGNLFAGMPEWKSDVAGVLPRLAWEYNSGSRICLQPGMLNALGSQTGRGSLSLPYVVCNASQLKDIQYASSGSQYYMLGDDINISSWLAVSNIVSNFAGVLLGNYKVIYGFNLSTPATSTNVGIIANNTGIINNLKLLGNKVDHNSGTGATGLLTGVNSGYIQNISAFGNEVLGNDYTGVIAGSSSGTILSVDIDQTSIVGKSFTGGVTGFNDGVVRIAGVNARISTGVTTAYKNVGGVVGANNMTKVVDQVMFSGQMQFDYPSTNIASEEPALGMIIGHNKGILSNSLVKNYAQMTVKNPDSIGGLVGYNSGSLSKSFSLGRMIYDNSGAPLGGSDDFAQLAGLDDGTTDLATTFSLENNAGARIASATSGACTANTSLAFEASPTFLLMGATDVDLMAPNDNSSSGDSLKNLTVVGAIATNYVVPISTACPPYGQVFSFFKSHGAAASNTRAKAFFANPANYSSYDLGREASDSTARNVDRLLAFHISRMNHVAPVNPPIWNMDEGDEYPNLLQVRD